MLALCMATVPAIAVDASDGAPAKPRLIVEDSTVYYSVHGRNLEELILQLHVPDAGELGRETHGLTRSKLRLDGELTQTSKGCLMSGYTIQIVLRMDLPHWDETVPMSRSLVGKWEQINVRLSDMSSGTGRTHLMVPCDCWRNCRLSSRTGVVSARRRRSGARSSAWKPGEI